MNEIFLHFIISISLSFKKLNKSSAETTRNVTKIKIEITQYFQNMSRVFNQSSALDIEADRQRQVFLAFDCHFDDIVSSPNLFPKCIM